MSQWDVTEFSLDRSVEDLQKVTEVAGPRKPFVLLGISQGGATAIRYAVAHPDHVSHLILYGVYAQGRAVAGDREVEERYRAIIALTRLGWGQDNPVYRQLFTARFIPGASEEQLRWFTDLCWRTITAGTAARIMESRMHIDVVDLLPRVAMPALVLHARSDECVAPAQGRLIASSIPSARFVELDSRNHILLETEPAWKRFKEEVLAFTGRPAEGRRKNDVFAALSPREREVLAKIAAGLHEHRDRQTTVHQREDRAQSRDANLREARRPLACASHRARQGQRTAPLNSRNCGLDGQPTFEPAVDDGDRPWLSKSRCRRFRTFAHLKHMKVINWLHFGLKSITFNDLGYEKVIIRALPGR